MYPMTQRLREIQNLGLFDRTLRGIIAIGLIAGPVVDLLQGATFGWHGYAILASVYPAMTAMLGWDPAYEMFQVRSCGTNSRSQCGTFPYEVDAALGHNPTPMEGYEYDHSLTAALHRK